MSRKDKQIRRRTITAKDEELTVQVQVLIVSEPGTMGRDEINRMNDRISDKIMVAIVETPYVKVPLSRIKVSS